MRRFSPTGLNSILRRLLKLLTLNLFNMGPPMPDIIIAAILSQELSYLEVSCRAFQCEASSKDVSPDAKTIRDFLLPFFADAQK